MSERVSHILGEAREGLIKMEVEMKLDAGEKRSLMLFLVTLCSNPRTRFPFSIFLHFLSILEEHGGFKHILDFVIVVFL